MCLNNNIKVWLRRIAPCLLEWFILNDPSIKTIFVPFCCLLLFLLLSLLILYRQQWWLKVILKSSKYFILKNAFSNYMLLHTGEMALYCTCSYSFISRHITFEPVLLVFWKAFETWKLVWFCIYLFVHRFIWQIKITFNVVLLLLQSRF